MTNFGDVQPFIEENDDISPAYRLKILGLRQAHLLESGIGSYH